MLSMQEEARITQGIIGKRITVAREKRGWNIDTLARLVGLTREALRMIERGNRMPRTDTLMRIAGTLKVAIDELLPPGWQETYGPLAWANQQVASDVGKRPKAPSSPTTERRKTTGQRHKQGKRPTPRKSRKMYLETSNKIAGQAA